MVAEVRRQRGASAGLTREAIVAAAETVIASAGFEGTSMRSVAVELGVTPGALYNHFANKRALLDAVADEFISREVMRRVPRSAAPLERLRTMCRRLHSAGMAHPQVLLSVVGYIPDRLETAQLGVADVMLAALREAGAPADEVPVLYRALMTLSVGNAVYDANVASFPRSEVKRRLARHVESSPYRDVARYLQTWPARTTTEWFDAQLDLILGSLDRT